MTAAAPADAWDAIVIGSGMGGLSAACALARAGRRALVLEQHTVAGGMTQTFQRQGFQFAVGLHYIGGCSDQPGPAGQLGRMLRWLGDGDLRFAPLPPAFDVVHLPQTGPTPARQFALGHPESAMFADLKQRFPDDAQAIDRYAALLASARRWAMRAFMLQAAPPWVAQPARWLARTPLRRAAEHTVADALAGIANPTLRALLAARGGDYGLSPQEAPLMLHATVLGSYDHGAWYPVGGPSRLTHSLLSALQVRGGEVRTGCAVQRIDVAGGRCVGVTLASGEVVRAPRVISAMGAPNTAQALCQPQADGTALADAVLRWCAHVNQARVSASYVALYLGFSGDPRAAGMDGANHWIYESSPDRLLWTEPVDEDAPSLFVSFGSLNDPQHVGPHTAEVLAPCRWEFFERWAHSGSGARPEAYEATKAWIAQRLLAQFGRHFPQLARQVVFHELATPLTHAWFARAPRGAMYGLRMDAQRLLDPAFQIRTPVPGLLLAGQDALSLGIAGATMGGVLAAAVAEPALWRAMPR